MLTSIDLDNETSLLAEEIDHIGTYRHLTAEFVAEKTAGAQVVPQRSFRIGHLGTKSLDFLFIGKRTESGEMGSAWHLQNNARFALSWTNPLPGPLPRERENFS